jgi:hypothetical protein
MLPTMVRLVRWSPSQMLYRPAGRESNTIYLTEAGPIPHLPENAKVMSLSLKTPATEVASAAGLNVGYSSTWNLARE